MPQMKEFIAVNEEWLTVFHFPSTHPISTRRKASGH
jgi:hypothetical protein